MALLRTLPRRYRLLLSVTIAGAVVGAAHSHSDWMAGGSPLLSIDGVLQGVFTGALITAALTSFEIIVMSWPVMARLRSAPLPVHLAVKTLVYLAIIQLGLAIGRSVAPPPHDPSLWLAMHRWDVLFSFAVAFAFNLLFAINTLLGPHVLLNFMTGRYHRPHIEERIFLFIDMEGSAMLAERLGPLTFHQLVNRFVIDLTGPIVAAKGAIHQYVGDELVATWKLEEGIADARCVRACFDALERLAALAPGYRRDFGTTITARAALHGGPVVTGEMGSIKKEIVFLGDTVNTTARIAELCRATGHQVLASAALVDRIALPPEIAKRSLGDLPLRGKEQTITLYALEASRGGSAAAASGQDPLPHAAAAKSG
jgi:adenylate cyclase